MATSVFEPTRWLGDGDRVRFGEVELEVLHCPGHTPGHVIFFHRATRFAFVGDVLFAGSVGRTDFPRGDYQALLEAITGKLWPLGDEVTFVPGHGPPARLAASGAATRSSVTVPSDAVRPTRPSCEGRVHALPPLQKSL